MASYLELAHDLRVDVGYTQFQDRVAQAITQKARNMVQTTPTAEQLSWASAALAAPREWSAQVINYVVADAQEQTPSITVAQILAGSDAALQGFVDEAVDNLYGVIGGPA